VTKEGLPDAGKQDLLANLFFGEPIQHSCCNVIILLNVVLASIVPFFW
jgi:hypothetical protein